MNKTQSNSSFRFQVFCLIITGILLTYLVLRAFITEFLSDETATYWYFVYRGAFHGEKIVMDAANHPLNSLLGHWMYRIFGDVKGWIRIFSVISYLFYAWASYQLMKEFTKRKVRYLGFLALNCIPYMLEYFAYSRGYGLSLGFFLVAVYHAIQLSKVLKMKHLLLAYLFIGIAFAANLTLSNTVLLFIGLGILIQWINRKNLSLKHHLLFILAHVTLVVYMLPFIDFALRLKEAGALYYSSLDGIWDMTGKTLSRYVFFLDHDAWMYAYIAIFIAFVYLLFRSFSFKNLHEWVAKPIFTFNFLFFGNIVAAVLLALLLKVNYPEDRTGMYLIPLFIYLFIYLLNEVKYSEWILLFFPISLLSNLSFHSSVFTPEERLTEQLYREIIQEVDDEETVAIYKTMFANWHYQSSHFAKKTSVAQTNMDHTNLVDIFVTIDDVQENDTLKNEHLSKNYRRILHNSNSGHSVYRRIKKAQENLVFESNKINKTGDGEFLDIVNFDTLRKITLAKNLKISVLGNLSIAGNHNETDLVLASFSKNEKGEEILEHYYPYVYELAFQGQHVNHKFKHHFLLENMNTNETVLKVYLWNRKTGIKHQLSDAYIKIYELN